VDKVLYIGFGMVASGAVTVIVWQSLLIDRRDALVLGVLPVDSRTVVRAKLLAVAAYTAIVAVSMHALSSLAFGFFLAAGLDLLFALRGVVAHFMASAAASAFVLLAVCAIQGTGLTILGPRRFARLSPVMQVGLVATVLLGFLSLPVIGSSVNSLLLDDGRATTWWALLTPPAWFLGVYEVALGTDDPALRRLALSAVLAFGAALLITVLSYPLAYRRVMATAVEAPSGPRRRRAARAPSRALGALVGRAPEVRAACQFLLTTMVRSERHRFVVASTVGLAIAIALPTILRDLPLDATWPDQPPGSLLSMPVALMIAVLVGLRVTIALPADLRASWLFAAADAPTDQIRAGLWRVMMALVVLPASLLLAPIIAATWGIQLAVTHAALCIGTGSVVAEALLTGFGGMPCARPWRPERARLRALWPAYLTGFLVTTGTVSSLSLTLADRPFWVVTIVAALFATRLGLKRLRTSSAFADMVQDEESFPKLQILDLA
jgi:hypothetical protein